MTDLERMLAGKLYDPFNVNDGAWEESRLALEKFNKDPFRQKPERLDYLRDIFGSLGENAEIVPYFYCDKGRNIYIGDNFYANTGLTILDEAKVSIGDNCFLGPHVSIYTATHPIAAKARNTGLEYALEINIGDNVWIGGDVCINPGVSIGENSVIGSASVVTKDIPSNVVAAGNPCKVIRKITEEDEKFWSERVKEYYADDDK